MKNIFNGIKFFVCILVGLLVIFSLYFFITLKMELQSAGRKINPIITEIAQYAEEMHCGNVKKINDWMSSSERYMVYCNFIDGDNLKASQVPLEEVNKISGDISDKLIENGWTLEGKRSKDSWRFSKERNGIVFTLDRSDVFQWYSLTISYSVKTY